MKYFAVHDAEGNISGRLKVSLDRTAELYKDIAVELTAEEHDNPEPVERTHKLDMDHFKKTGHKRLKRKETKEGRNGQE